MAERYDQGKNEAADVIRRTFDTIHEDKSKYESMSEKELLVETMLALGGYGRRLDRVEGKIESLSEYRVFIDGMNQQLNIFSSNIASLTEMMQDTAGIAAKTRESAKVMTDAIVECNDKLRGGEVIQEKVEKLSHDLPSAISVLNGIKSKMDVIVDETQDFVDEFGKGPIHTINEMRSTISIHGQKMAAIQDRIGEMESNIINETNDIYNSLNSAKSIMSDIDDSMDSIRYKINNIEEKTESALDRYGYDSIFSAIENIKSGT